MECFPLTLVGGFPDADVTNDQFGRGDGPGFFLHRWGGDDPTILYNITR